ncbi:hypothetical protein [Allosphingosinicella sp.]|jgi:hypothetical protein|uniref:hypothetical protein n=1 Tax=Allosphingosinicella sp. TaxID=2823234 RepID=UPI002F09A166
MLHRLFPSHVDNEFGGYRAALWLLGLYVAIKIVMSVNSIFNAESVAVGGDGIPLDSFGPEAARAVLMLFALMSLGQLMLALIALVTLIRWRALVPAVYLLLIAEHLGRRFIVHSYAVARTEATPVGAYVNYALLALLALGLVLSLLQARRARS